MNLHLLLTRDPNIAASLFASALTIALSGAILPSAAAAAPPGAITEIAPPHYSFGRTGGICYDGDPAEPITSQTITCDASATANSKTGDVAMTATIFDDDPAGAGTGTGHGYGGIVAHYRLSKPASSLKFTVTVDSVDADAVEVDDPNVSAFVSLYASAGYATQCNEDWNGDGLIDNDDCKAVTRLDVAYGSAGTSLPSEVRGGQYTFDVVLDPPPPFMQIPKGSKYITVYLNGVARLKSSDSAEAACTADPITVAPICVDNPLVLPSESRSAHASGKGVVRRIVVTPTY